MIDNEQQKTSEEEPSDQAEREPTAAEDAAEAAEAAEEAVEDIAGAEVTLEHLHDELAAAKDAALRAQADAQNARRRAEQEVEKARKFALERFAGELLPVVDNLERTLEASTGEGAELQTITEGVDLTLKGLLDCLKRFQIEVVDPAGEPFDPQLHQAMSMLEHADAEPNSVLHVMQKGYMLNSRLLRAAMVTVSKGPAKS